MSKQNIVEYKINPHSVIIEWGLVYMGINNFEVRDFNNLLRSMVMY